MRRTVRNILCDHCYKQDGSLVPAEQIAVVIGTRKTKADLCEKHRDMVLTTLVGTDASGKPIAKRRGRPPKVKQAA